ncbi:Major pollen allergen Cor a 1 isoforms 5, 6, 11 and 16 [Hibiscus syriacus]|uniref:Major pollen allergen Cor a 1 isoforms 5, 6, 11 and 16 n=1 Tax=Hibiscus syriacus TaxID=106335 RepID=A0A6A2Z3U7_HIBSY|nr:Major pollen allergen Cor a 1 isoforms 5, 6, 11 and 16 [Hibiscus syriacus]
MGVFTHEMEVVPHAIKSVEVLEGDGGPGTIKKINFADGMGITYVKHKVHTLDKQNRSTSYSAFEGDALGEKIEKTTEENKFDPAPNGGTIIKITTKFHSVGDAVITEEEMKKVMESRAQVYRAVEQYLVANPDA